MASSDHDLLLGRVLPHVRTGVVYEAQRSILDLDWDDSDSVDYEFDPRSMTTPSRQSRTNSTSEISYTGRSGGLSPPRRVAAFADFDGVNEPMFEKTAERWETARSSNKHITATFPQVPEEQLERTNGDLRRKSDSRASHSVVSATSAASSMRHQRRLSGGYSPNDPPPRSSSSRLEKSTADNSGLITIATTQILSPGTQGQPAIDKPLPPVKEPPRSRGNVTIRNGDDEEQDNLDLKMKDLGEHVMHRNGAGQPASSTAYDGSSTPPPIASVRPTRMVVYDDFEEEDPLSGFEEHEPRQTADLAAGQLFDETRKPSMVHRNKEKRLDSLNSDRGRGQNGTLHGRLVPLAANYRDLRTPVLDHVQLYHDAESKRPLFDPTAEGRASRSVSQKPRRIVDDTMYNGHASGSSATTIHEQSLKLPLRRAFSDDEVSVRHSISGKTVASLSSQNMPDFFTASIFQVVLHNPTTAYRLLKFSETRLCAENVEFLSKVDAYRTTLNGLAAQMSTIHKNYIAPGSPSQINVNGSLLKRAHRDMRSLVTSALPSMENLFTELQEQIETLVFQDVYPRFVRHQMALSASRALASDRFKYQGLGDCFCLTNPNVADNPIVFASDGFVKVTGYTRPEIVPRNCRFLQGAHTDRQAVTRLRNAIHEQKESVELLLNYKKNGDPFWNLLYVVPLFNSRGKCEFFLGGQVNCSTTIHSNVDVMRVLSLSDQIETDEAENNRIPTPTTHKQAARPSARRTFLKALGVRHDDHPPLPTGDAGMENHVLGRMEGQDLSAQMKEFYTAYSRFLVVRANNYNIEFYSEGVVESLNPANMASSMVAGSEVFRFLGLHMLSKQSEYKTRVRNAMRAGVPVSTSLRLQTRRSAVFRGDEAFVAHWTPLKDDKAVVHWIVITLAPTSA